MAALSDMNERERCVTLETGPPYSCGKRLAEERKATARTDGGNLSFLQSKREAEKILCERLDLEGVADLMEIASSRLERDVDTTSSVNDRKPVIVIEGLDGTGKTTLRENLSKEINAKEVKTPPECIAYLRSTFDEHPHMIRRAYYSLGNYLTAQEIAEAATTSPVVLDRFWHSTAAYAIATEIGSGNSSQLPEAGHPIYQWPQDLLKPDIVVLLEASPAVRFRRIKSRKEEMTEEEKRMERDTDFEERVLKSYKRIQGPKLKVVNASGTQAEVLKAVRGLLKEEKLVNGSNY